MGGEGGGYDEINNQGRILRKGKRKKEEKGKIGIKGNIYYLTVFLHICLLMIKNCEKEQYKK